MVAVVREQQAAGVSTNRTRFARSLGAEADELVAGHEEERKRREFGRVGRDDDLLRVDGDARCTAPRRRARWRRPSGCSPSRPSRSAGGRRRTRGRAGRLADVVAAPTGAGTGRPRTRRGAAGGPERRPEKPAPADRVQHPMRAIYDGRRPSLIAHSVRSFGGQRSATAQHGFTADSILLSRRSLA